MNNEYARPTLNRRSFLFGEVPCGQSAAAGLWVVHVGSDVRSIAPCGPRRETDPERA